MTFDVYYLAKKHTCVKSIKLVDLILTSNFTIILTSTHNQLYSSNTLFSQLKALYILFAVMRSTFSRRYYFNETESQSRGIITKSKEIWRSLLLESSLERLAFCFLFFWLTKKINKCELYDCKKKSFVLMYRSNFHLLPRSTFC